MPKIFSMHWILVPPLLTIVLCATVAANGIQTQNTPTSAPTPPPTEDPKVIETKIHSAALSEDRSVIIHLPGNYSKDTSQRLPVMYVLDGTSQDQHTADKVAVLSDAGLIPKAIVVGLPNTRGNRERDQTPPFMRRNVDDEKSPYGAGDKFLTFIEKELIPFIDSSYRTSSYRTLSGNSRGALFVWYSLMERPELFQARFCYSAPVWRFENLMVIKVTEFLRSSTPLSGFLYMSVGEKETDRMIGGFAKMKDALMNNRRKHFRWIAYQTPYAVHQDNALISTSKGLVEWGNYLRQTKK
jgi:predicted alpha/beta superfamily hydrolase